MKVFKLHLAEVTVGIFFVIMVACFFRGSGYDTEFSAAVPCNEDWICVTEEGITEYPVLPEKISIPEGREEIILRRELDEDVISINSLGFYTSHQEVAVFVEGKQIYRKKVPKNVPGKTPGNCWNFVQMQEEYAKKTLEIRLRNCYDYGSVEVPEFTYGPQSAIVVQQLNRKTPSLLTGISMLVLGLILVLSWFTIGKKMHFHEGIQWLGLFTIYFAIWSTMETQVPALMFGREIMCNQITFMSLKLMVLPIVCFIQVVYQMKGSRLWNGFAFMGILDFAASFVFQFFGWADYRETIWVTHLIGISIIFAAMISGGSILFKRRKEIFAWKRRVYINIIGICIIGGSMLMDALNYYYGFYDDVAAFSRVGCLLFVLILTVQFLDVSMGLIEAGKKAEIIREEAETDGLTMLKNRRVFEADFQGIPEHKFEKCAIAMFDLNNLKKVNDLFGHGMGDCYIITGSEIIRDVFGEFGEIYRIGGDEFCLISERITSRVFQEKEEDMCRRLESLKGIQTSIKEYMQIASGCAVFDRKMDRNLQDTMGRADKQMYQCKKRQKEQKTGGV